MNKDKNDKVATPVWMKLGTDGNYTIQVDDVGTKQTKEKAEDHLAKKTMAKSSPGKANLGIAILRAEKIEIQAEYDSFKENTAKEMKKKEAPAPEAPKGPTQEELLAEIRDLLKK